MSRKKLKERKSKAKERATAEKKHKQRLFAIREKRAERAKAKLEREERERLEPIRTSDIEKIDDALNRNLEVLKALEEEYVASQLARQNVNDELEAEGYTTIEEKVEALKKKAGDMISSGLANIQKQVVPDGTPEELITITKNENDKKTG